MYKIGDFSKLTNLTIKALRYYDDEGLLKPSYRDNDNNYRYYEDCDLEKANIIKLLKELDFSIIEIKEIVNNYTSNEDLVYYLKEQKEKVNEKILNYNKLLNKIDTYITQNKERKEMKIMEKTVEIKEIDPILVASIRYKGKYNEVGKYIGKIFKEIKGKCVGGPFNLYYDGEYKELADVEVCIPIAKEITSSVVECKTLPKIKAVTITHLGSYETISESYSVLYDYLNKNKLETYTPAREIYIKGPGMIFKGNPNKYITELVIPIK